MPTCVSRISCLLSLCLSRREMPHAAIQDRVPGHFGAAQRPGDAVLLPLPVGHEHRQLCHGELQKRTCARAFDVCTCFGVRVCCTRVYILQAWLVCVGMCMSPPFSSPLCATTFLMLTMASDPCPRPPPPHTTHIRSHPRVIRIIASPPTRATCIRMFRSTSIASPPSSDSTLSKCKNEQN